MTRTVDLDTVMYRLIL